jgi:hypothetical protein
VALRGEASIEAAGEDRRGDMSRAVNKPDPTVIKVHSLFHVKRICNP